MKQEEIREKFRFFLKNYGVKCSFVAKQLGIDISLLNKYKLGLVNLSEQQLQKLNDFLDDRFSLLR
jgi:transcriptional regulator with XRE-family HTH domain